MKTQLKVLLAMMMLFGGCIIYSCSKKETSKDVIKEKALIVLTNTNQLFEATYKVNNYLYTYTSKVTGSTTASVLNVKNTTGGKDISINFSVDTSLSSFKLAIHDKVLLESQRIKDDFDLNGIKEVTAFFETFGKELIDDPKINQSSQLIQSLFLHNAALSTIKRSFVQNTDCGCTPHPAYFIGKTSFWCQEDYLINPQDYVNTINKSNYKMSPKELKVYNYLLQNVSKPYISIDNVLNVIETKEVFLQRVSNVYYSSTHKVITTTPPQIKLALVQACPLGAGSDLGCCGNYAGCYWYVSLLCLAHDLACLKCDHWYCGPQCKPETNAS